VQHMALGLLEQVQLDRVLAQPAFLCMAMLREWHQGYGSYSCCPRQAGGG
jgi:hypothetical protein